MKKKDHWTRRWFLGFSAAAPALSLQLKSVQTEVDLDSGFRTGGIWADSEDPPYVHPSVREEGEATFHRMELRLIEDTEQGPRTIFRSHRRIAALTLKKKDTLRITWNIAP